jgi:tetratricopeptide (TPR) repeat protein
MDLASNALRRQDKVGAAVILLRALRRSPDLLDEYLPLTLEIFTEAINGAGLEKELLDVIVLCAHPAAVLSEVYEALESVGKSKAIEAIERMRRRHTRLHDLDLHYVPLPASDLSALTLDAQDAATQGISAQSLDYAYVGVGVEARAQHALAASPLLSSSAGSRHRRAAVTSRSGFIRVRPPVQPPVDVDAALSDDTSDDLDAAFVQATHPPVAASTSSTAPSAEVSPYSPRRTPAASPVSAWAPGLTAEANATTRADTSSRPASPEPEPVTESAVLAALSADMFPALREPSPATSPLPPTAALTLTAGDQDTSSDLDAQEDPEDRDDASPTTARSLRPHPSLARSRRRLHLTAALVAVLSAGGAYTFISRHSTTQSTQRAQLNEARSLARARSASDLARARDLCLGIYQADPSHHEAAAWAFFFDRALASTFHQTPAIDPSSWPAAIQANPLFEAGLILDLLSDPQRPNTAQEAQQRIASFSAWDAHPGLRAWLEGRAAIAAQQPKRAAAALAQAIDSFELSLWPLLDLGAFALAQRHHDAIQAFLTRALPRRAEHPFLSVAHHASTLSLLKPPTYAPPAVDPSALADLTPTERAWTLLLASHHALFARDLVGAERLAARALQSQSLPESEFLAGLLHLASPSPNPDAALAAFSSSLPRFPTAPHMREHRAFAAQALLDAARPDLTLQLLLPSLDPSLDPSLTTSELTLVAYALSQTAQYQRLSSLAEAARASGRASDDLLRLAWLAAQRQGASAADLKALARSLAKPDDAPAQLLLLDQRLPDLSFEDAFSEAQRLSASFPLHPDLIALRIELLSTSGDGDLASSIALSSSSSSPLAHTRSQILSALALSRATSLTPDLAAAAAHLPTTDLYLLQAQAEIAWRAGLPDLATALSSQALALDPDAPSALAIQGMMQVHSQTQDAQAISLLERGLQGPRTLPGLLLTLAQRYQRTGQIPKATHAYLLAMAKPSDRALALDLLARMFLDAKRLTSGRQALNRLLSLYPNQPPTTQIHARIQMWMGAMYAPWTGDKEAHAWLSKAQKTLGDQDPILLFYLGWYHEATQRKAAAISHYRQALALDPHFSQAASRLDALSSTPPRPKLKPKPKPSLSSDAPDPDPTAAAVAFADQLFPSSRSRLIPNQSFGQLITWTRDLIRRP